MWAALDCWLMQELRKGSATPATPSQLRLSVGEEGWSAASLALHNRLFGTLSWMIQVSMT